LLLQHNSRILWSNHVPQVSNNPFVSNWSSNGREWPLAILKENCDMIADSGRVKKSLLKIAEKYLSSRSLVIHLKIHFLDSWWSIGFLACLIIFFKLDIYKEGDDYTYEVKKGPYDNFLDGTFSLFGNFATANIFNFFKHLFSTRIYNHFSRSLAFADVCTPHWVIVIVYVL